MKRRAFIHSVTALTGLACSKTALAEGLRPAPAAGDSTLPTLKIGRYEISRMIIGGNPFSSIAHAEPLQYAGELFRHYFTPQKIVATLQLCRQHGINTFLGRIDNQVSGFLNLYEKETGQRYPWIGQTAKKPMAGAGRQDIIDNMKFAADQGAIGIYLQGESCDYWVKNGQIREMEVLLAHIRRMGLIAGLGAHENRTIVEAEAAGLHPDFYMKTFNALDYLALDSAATAEIMATATAPWIAFKVLAAGRLSPATGFKQALDAGAGFLCVGMFDFQVAKNVQVLQGLLSA